MKVYFTDRQVPEMSGLVLSQRSVVRQGAFDLFCLEHPAARWKVRLGNGAAVGMGCLFAFMISDRFLIQLLAVVVGAMPTMLLFQSFLTERLRPYFRRYIEENQDRISSSV